MCRAIRTRQCGGVAAAAARVVVRVAPRGAAGRQDDAEPPLKNGTDLGSFPIHLGLGATAGSEPRFTGDSDWYGAYVERHEPDGAEGRLVSLHAFTEPWAIWELHPLGSEVVLCIAGTMTLHQEFTDGARLSLTLGAGQYAINPPGVWHTADVSAPATALFITAGKGTQHRPR